VTTPAPMEQFRAYLSREGLRYTRQRRAIVEAFFGSGEHLPLAEIHALARTREPSIGFATVYRTMKLLVRSGLAVEQRFDEGQSRYEPVTERGHHDHLICVRCGRIVEFEDGVIEARQEAIAARHGFRMFSHRHEIYGECLEGCPEPSSER